MPSKDHPPSLTLDTLFAFWGLLGEGLLGARWRRRTGEGEGESERPEAWRTTLQIPISSVSGSLLD
eukprot:617722-Pelagomonas_calceolata.AAC.1